MATNSITDFTQLSSRRRLAGSHARTPAKIAIERLDQIDDRGAPFQRSGPDVAAALPPKNAPMIFPKMPIVYSQWTRDITSL